MIPGSRLIQSRVVRSCQSSFLPLLILLNKADSQPECQRRARSDYHRKKPGDRPGVFQVVRDSQKQWWAEHPATRNNTASRTEAWSRATVSVKDCGIGSVGLNFLSGTT